MRYLFILLLITSTAYGQYVPFGATRIQDTSRTLGSIQANGGLILPLYATPDSNVVAGFDSRGRVVFRSKSGGSGTVTNVSTGFGMLGGPITTTGTVRVDSNAVLTVARGYKVSDSVAGLKQSYSDTSVWDATRSWTNTAISGKMNYTDTIALSNRINTKQGYADTSTWDATRSWVIGQIPSVTGYVPYTGATSNTNTGEYGIKAGQYDLDLTPTGTYTTGTTYWDATHLAPATYLNSSVTQVNGQTFYMRGRNNTGTTIAKGKAVYVNDAQGNNPTISLADADSVTTSQVIGVTAESIADNGTGYVMVSGYLDGVNTSSYADGDALYLDTTNGNLTNQLLPSPHNVVFVAYALNSTVNGRYFIRPSSPIASDTTMTAGSNQIAPTQAAVKKFVQSRGYGASTTVAAGTGISVAGVAPAYTVTNTAPNQTVNIAAGTGISIGGSYPSYSVTNTAPDQTVSLTGAGTVSVTGTYPTFTVTGTGGSGGVAAITSTGSTMQVTGTTTVNVEVDTTHPFTFTGTNTFTRDITIDSVVFGSGNGLSTNIKIGRSALAAPTTATATIAVGESACRLITTGIGNIAIGRNAIANSSVSVNGLVAVGTSNLNYSTGDNNTAIGAQCMARAVAWNGIANAGVGANSGSALTSGSTNSWIGAGAGNALTSGSSNTFLGVNSGNAITTGGQNSILGAFTGNSGGLDIRTLSNRVVLSDGGANIRAYHNGTNWLIGTVTDGSTGILQLSGSLGLNTAGNKLNIATGTNASVGTGTLSSGTVTINTTAVTASSIIQVQLTSCSSCGTLYIGTVTAGTSFVVNSTNGADASTFNYWIIN